MGTLMTINKILPLIQGLGSLLLSTRDACTLCMAHRRGTAVPCRDAKKPVSGWEKHRVSLWHSFGTQTHTFQQVEPQQ